MMTNSLQSVVAAVSCLILFAGPAVAGHDSHHTHRSHHSDRHSSRHSRHGKEVPADAESSEGAAVPAAAATSGSAAASEQAPAPAQDASASEPPVDGKASAAEQADLGATDRPWAKDVSPGDQQAALELFREANGMLKESLFPQAAAKYREALAHWDHPAIHYNLALALFNLDQPVEVYAHIQEALKYGEAPLESAKFEHAKRYLALIEKQVARIEVTCSEPGALVTMDGRTLFSAPGRHEELVRAGQHTIVATKRGYVTVQKTPTLPAGEKTSIDFRMYTAEQLTHFKRRWSTAMPIAVLITGLVVAGGGGIMHWQASEAFNQYDSGINDCSFASSAKGCYPDSALAGKKSLGETLQPSAFVAYGVGGALVVTGAVLTILNRAKPIRIDTDSTDTHLTVAPVLGPGVAGFLASIRY